MKIDAQIKLAKAVIEIGIKMQAVFDHLVYINNVSPSEMDAKFCQSSFEYFCENIHSLSKKLKEIEINNE